MTTLTHHQQLLAAALMEQVPAIQFGQFRLKLHERNPDAPLAPIYIDLRVVPSNQEVVDLVVTVLAELIAPLTYQRIADIPEAATRFVAVLANRVRKPMVWPRMQMKTHGTSRRVEGVFTPSDTVLVIDDLITDGGSKLEAIDVLESEDLTVTDVAMVIDREQGGREALAKRGYRLHAAMTLRQILAHYRETSRITAAQHDEVLAYLGGAR